MVKTKLLIMASLYEPQKYSGGPPISVKGVVDAIKESYDISIISKNHEIGEKEPLPGIISGWNYYDYGKVYYTPYGKHNYNDVLRIINKIKPEVIYQNSFFSADDFFPVLMYKRKNPRTKVIVAPRGELCPERVKVKAYKKRPYIFLMKVFCMLKDIYFHGTGNTEVGDIKRALSVKSEMIYNIDNIASIKRETQNNLKKEKGIVSLVFIARIHMQKNLANAIKYLSYVTGNVSFDIYGAIEDSEYWEKCKSEILKLPDNITVTYKGAISHEEVARTLSKYHAFYMPSIGENYGHSIAEALACGKPIVISDQTPWNDANNKAGYVVGLKDGQGFADAISKLCSLEQKEYDQMCCQAVSLFNKRNDLNILKEQYTKMFKPNESY